MILSLPPVLLKKLGTMLFDTMIELTPQTGLAECPTEAALAVIGGRWKVPILWHLRRGTLRFGELSRLLGAVTQKMLTQQLRELERDGIVHRRVFPEVPPRVEYSLTDFGTSLSPLLDALSAWGERFLRNKARSPEEGRVKDVA